MNENFRLLVFLLAVKGGDILSQIDINKLDRATVARCLGEIFLQFGKIKTSSNRGIIDGVFSGEVEINIKKLQTLIAESAADKSSSDS